MTVTKFDVVGIGNAIVDVLSHSDDGFLEKYNLTKGSMTIIDGETAEKLYSFMESSLEVSGGSVANTMACIASAGGSGAFVGKVCQDQLGGVFTNDIRRAGVSYETKPDVGGDPTARCLIYVTPDAERTMQTFLGACIALGPNDIDEQVIIASKVIYLEGYLYDPPQAKAAFVKAAKLAKNAGRKVALSLSDPFCVDRHRSAFVDLVHNHVDILFANEDEIKSLYQVDVFDEALEKVRGNCDVVALTRGSQGSVIVSGDETYVLLAENVQGIVDTTGAGDSYAAGFLYGLTQGKDLETCGQIGGILAADIITNYGARSKNDLKVLLSKNLRG
jgi:sugar/nucleoside kinase (ribokinase family)